MESAIGHLEESVQKADGKLDMIAWQIDAFEKAFEDPEDEISVLRLLHSVHQVTKDYQNLRQEILEVQQLQKQLSDSLRAQLTQGIRCTRKMLRAGLDLVDEPKRGPVIPRADQGKASQIGAKVVDSRLRNPLLAIDTAFTMCIQCALDDLPATLSSIDEY